MGPIKRLAFIAVILFPTPALAWNDMESMTLAHELGSVLASEAACGLTYDQDAIAAFIEKKVPADDMGFPSSLNMMTVGSEAQIADMSTSAKTAHCTQIRRIAKSNGFLR